MCNLWLSTSLFIGHNKSSLWIQHLGGCPNKMVFYHLQLIENTDMCISDDRLFSLAWLAIVSCAAMEWLFWISLLLHPINEVRCGNVAFVFISLQLKCDPEDDILSELLIDKDIGMMRLLHELETNTRTDEASGHKNMKWEERSGEPVVDHVCDLPWVTGEALDQVHRDAGCNTLPFSWPTAKVSQSSALIGEAEPGHGAQTDPTMLLS